ncbi:MAG: hypothetical protein J0I13_08450, partial [Rhizobiales bacterium]|nr:hypothetical protein [Hyphomicrobiales bacterium]
MSFFVPSSVGWPVQQRTALIVALFITLALLGIAHLVLFPVYETNDDVGIRLILEGRFVVGAEPSGYAYFINLVLGQVLAALYRGFPAAHWYDLAEHGAVALAATTVFYCGIRRMRTWADATFLLLAAAIFLATFNAIQFTIVATLCTMVGMSAVLLAQQTALEPREAWAVTTAGTVLIVIGALFRLEASLLGLAVVTFIVATNRVRRPLLKPLRPKLLVVPLAGVGLAGAAWTFHWLTLAQSPAWQEFFTFNLLRAQLSELFLARLDREILAQAYAAAGWSIAEHDLLTNWLFI